MVKTSFSILLCLLLFIVMFAFSALCIIRPNNISNLVAKVDIAWLLNDAGLSEEIKNELSNSLIDSDSLYIDNFNSFLRRDNVTSEIGNVIEQYVIAIVEGDFSYHITSREIINLIKTVAPDIHDEFEYRLTNEDYEKITLYLNEHGNLKEYSADKLLGETNINATIPYVLFSAYPLIIFGILCAMFAINIFLLHRKKVRLAFFYVSIPTILLGLIYTIIGLLSGPFSGFFADSNLYAITRFVIGLFSQLIFWGLILAGIGVIFFTIFLVVKKVKKTIPENLSGEKKQKVWLLTGLVFNSVALITCSVFSLLCFFDLP